MLATLLIVFREVLEAGLIVGIVLAATRDVPGRGVWIAFGVVAGLAGACIVAAFASEIGELFAGSGQELFNACVLILAVGMLTWHNVWMASHGREIAQHMKKVGTEVASGERPLLALAIVCGLALLREGSEVVLFLYGVFASGGSSVPGMIFGGILGVVAGAAVSALLYLGLLAIPTRRLFSVTSGLITLLAAGLAAQAVAFLQQGGYIEILTSTAWDTSWLLPEDSLAGRLLHTLIGYIDRPSEAQLVVYLATVALILTLMHSQRRSRAATSRPAVVEITSRS